MGTTAEALVGWARDVVGSAGDATLVLTLPAPGVAAERAVDILPPAYSFLWDPGGERVWVGSEAAVRLEERDGENGGPRHQQGDRFVRLRRRAEELFRRIHSVTHPACGGLAYAPRLFGGLAFTEGGAHLEPWRELGDGCFTLPRWLYQGSADAGAAASLSLVLTAADRRPRRPERWLEALEGILAELGRPAPRASDPLPAAPPAGTKLLRELPRSDRESWCGEVGRVRAAIAAGRFEKVVLARRLELDLGMPLAPERLLPHLDRAGRGSFRFAFRRPQAALLGATPERLISRRGRLIRTEALAGSIAGGEEQAARLLESAKDRIEHSLVVRHLVSRLAPLCRRLDWRPEPRIRSLPHLQHLETPVDGELAGDTHVLDLVAALHPTPAVGGVPTAEAVRFIVEHELAERGWYSGPVGWLDARGDGEFAVALRSCVLAGSRAFLWAGAGLVADSDPALEYEETVLKLRGIVGALEAALAGERAANDRTAGEPAAAPEMAAAAAAPESD
jgi:isochorismate synthase